MRTDEWLTTTTQRLASAGITTARLDSLVLLEDMLNKDRSWLLAHPERSLRTSDLEALDTKIAKRTQHIPLAYIRGKAEFYGREFVVDSHTLVPRPETETIVDLLEQLPLPTTPSILDVGTGSGCIAITVSLEISSSKVSACDIDDDCLKIAAQNAERLKTKVSFFKSDLLKDAARYDVLLANLPYVPENFQINTAATHEPRHALFGGKDGLDLYRTLFVQAKTQSPPLRYIITESLPPQHRTLASIAKAAGFTLRQTDDFIQVFELV